jgi:hypothetical protein
LVLLVESKIQDLTLEGFIHLQNKIKSDERLVLFSMEDIERGETADGKIAYIKALFDDFSGDKSALKVALTALENSFNSDYLFQKAKYGLTCLLNTDKPLFAGVLGKEKILNVCLTARQHAILLGLAAHNLGFEFDLAESVTLHPYGWIEVPNVVLQKELLALAAVFESTLFVIENQQQRFFRWSVAPSVLFLDEQLFTLSVLDSRETKIPVTITRAAIVTALGTVVSKSETFVITRRLARDLQKLSQHPSSNSEAFACEENYKQAKKGGFLVAGLKSLLCRVAGNISFRAQYN